MSAVLDEGMTPFRGVSGIRWWAPLIAGFGGLLIASLPLPQAAAVLAPFFVVIVYVEPLIGVALMLLVAPWGALERVAYGSGPFDSGQLLFLLTLGAWLVRSAVSRRIRLRVSAFHLPLVLFIFVTLLSLLDASSLSSGLREVVKWLEIGTVALMVADLSMTIHERAIGGWLGLHPDRWAWRTILFFILLGGMSQAFIGIWQFGLRGSGPEHFQIAASPFYRAYGTFEQPNPFGGFVSWMAALGIGAFIGESMRRMQTKTIDRWKFVWLVFLIAASLITLLALIFSWSRGAWLGFAAGMAAFLFFLPRKRLAGGLALGLGLAVFVLAWQLNWLPSVATQRLVSFTEDLRLGDVRGADINDANFAVLERLAHWQAAVAMAEYNLLDGVGFGNYETAYDDFALINWPAALGHAHNYYLNILAETGVVGLLSYLLFWLAVMWQTLRVIGRSHWPQRGLALGLFGAWVALGTHHMLDKLYVNNLYLYLGAMWGMLHVLERSAHRKV